MKLTTVYAFCGAAAVSALSLPHHTATEAAWDPLAGLHHAAHSSSSSSSTSDDTSKAAAAAGTLPLEKFGVFHTISIDDAKAGIVKAMKDFEDFMEDVGDAIEDAFNGTETDSSTSKGINGTPLLNGLLGGDKDMVQSAAAGECSNPHVRFEWRSYSDTDRHALMDAFRCLIDKSPSGAFPPASNRLEDFARVHQIMTPTVHGSGLFLFWHRYFAWALEQAMRDECGFDRAFPWWDETLDAGKFSQSSLFTADYFGSLPAGTNGNGTCIEDGAFAGLTCHIGPGANGSVPHCLSRAVDEQQTAQSNIDFVDTCNSRTSYSDMENCVELGPHGYGHNGIGSVMADVSGSPSDPVFYMHHLFIDRNFWLWQNADPARKGNVNGYADAQSPCTPLTLDTVVSIGGLRPDVKVRDLINTLDGAMCYEYTY